MKYGNRISCSAEELCRDFARDHHWVITRRQARDLGMSDDAVTRRARSGDWHVLHPGVFAPVWMPDSAKQQLYAACQVGGVGSVAFGGSAAWLHGLQDFGGRRPEVAVPRPMRQRNDILFRRMAIPDRHRRFKDGIPVIEPSRMLLHLGGSVSAEVLEIAVDQCLREKKTHLDVLAARLNKIGGKGVMGSSAMRKLLKELQGAKSPTGSVLESEIAPHL